MVKDRMEALEVVVLALKQALVLVEVMVPMVKVGLLLSVKVKALPPGNLVNPLVSYMPEVAEPEQNPPLLR